MIYTASPNVGVIKERKQYLMNGGFYMLIRTSLVLEP
jgi:hypothetical protein